ncbi:MAG: hypothetical protein OA34_11435 [Sulfurospirillum sp. MES]|nr:MAG: hypothetical protein OA34_11435 [Sulfurospirillum sp. MES]
MTNTIWTDSIFRWAGSKRKLLPILINNVPNNYERYIEPFCGSACLFFAIKPMSAILSDINGELIHTFEQIKNTPSLIAKTLSNISVSKEIYDNYRQQKPTHLTDFERAIRFTYLNRNCFNGVYRTNQRGEFNVPMGTRTGEVPDEIRFIKCAEALKNAKLISQDFEKLLPDIQKNDFVYLDPPYAKKDYKGRGEYGPGAFQYEDITRMLTFLEEVNHRGANFLFSYAYDEELIQQLPQSWYWESVLVGRHVAGFSQHRKHVQEILVSNYKIKI